MRGGRRALAAAAALAALLGCGRRECFAPEGLVLGGRRVPAATLERGRDVYNTYCRQCHGEAGDGRGPAAGSTRPPPRDFRLGVVKFAAVPSGRLPNDDDLVRVVRGGLDGTAMLGWQLPDGDVHAVVQYLKTFSPRWRRERPGPRIAPTPDPWGPTRRAEAEARGRALYHGLAQCSTCHPAYATRAEIGAYVRALQDVEATELRPDPYGAVLRPTDWGTPALPPDFTRHPLRAGDGPEDLYRTLAAGVGGTAMPGWRGVLSEADIWAMVHYVGALTRLRDTPGADALAARLAAQLGADAGTPPRGF